MVENSIDENMYIPGTCNLGRQEIQSRINKAKFGLALSVILILIIEIGHLSDEWRLFLFFPLTYTIICFIQAKQKFCVAFGYFGVFNFEEYGKRTRIKENEFIKKDRVKALQLTAWSFSLTCVLVLIYYFLGKIN